ncbi:PREDICTED: uncharacterized protein LOC106751992 [Dinoponera quadriceps]|uniref:Uncharacterized protein LOC106751992 n=1 Tax=Dinoponera quadriceps TaxID=609295 RepID=A0A6P3YCN2_DINQU|nr:PREDICTED: uncharacterized protein LOC106751992 [Dinoponera quadriceps]
MDFQNVNPLNVQLNYVSGNLLPVAPCNSQFSSAWKLYGGLTWLLQVAQVSVLMAGFALVSWEHAIQEGTLTFVFVIEVFFIAGHLQTQGKLAKRLIQKLNDILQIDDEIMKDIVIKTIKPIETPLRYYCMVGSLCVTTFFSLQFLTVFEKDTFIYEDFKMPIAFTKQPFSIRTFVLGCILIMVGNIQIFLKKCGLDMYIIHFVLMITAQYRYIATKLTTIFRDADKQCNFRKVNYEVDHWTENEIKALCRHHINVICLSGLLKELLSSSLNMIYINSVVLSTTLVEMILVAIYSSGAIVEFYMLCSYVQQLQDAFRDIPCSIQRHCPGPSWNDEVQDCIYLFGGRPSGLLFSSILFLNIFANLCGSMRST